MLSQHDMHKQTIPACNWPIRSQGSQTHYPSMQQKPITDWESYTCYPSTDTLSQHTLQKLTCIKEAEKAQKSGQADTVK